jgi:Uma2 family endonuclease
MAAISEAGWTAEAYLAYDRASELRHEYIGGEMIAMVGASRAHNLIVFNLALALGTQLKGGPCEAYVNDMRVQVTPSDYLYPDVVVVCGEPQFTDASLDTLLNPTLLIEVLSPSTEARDRGAKTALYRALGSVQEYLLVAQERAHIERYARTQQGWLLTEAHGLEGVLELAAAGCTLRLADVYDRITFGTPAPGDASPHASS